MVRIRLAKGGAKKDPFYRIIAVDQNRRREGKALEVLGYWYPKKDSLKLEKERLKYWLSVGAKTSKSVDKIISKKRLV